jgi:hypothetical protein
MFDQDTTGLASKVPQQGGVGGLLSKLQGGISCNNPVSNAIEGGVVSSPGCKFGPPLAATGASVAALPALLQKFAHRANDPNDHSITTDDIIKSPGNIGGLGNLFNH